jgi:hypothetical protein
MTKTDDQRLVSRVARGLKHELLEMAVPFVFFLIGFNVIALTLHLALQAQGIVYDGIANATIGALLVAKVVLLVDHIPLSRWYKAKRLIGLVVYRSAVYTVFVLVLQIAEFLVGQLIHGQTIAGALSALRNDLVWQHAVAVHLWVFALFFAYTSVEEIRRRYGLPPVREILAAPVQH